MPSGWAVYFRNEDGELFERVNNHEAVAMVGEELLEVLERSSWNLKAVLLIVVVPPEAVEDLLALEVVFE